MTGDRRGGARIPFGRARAVLVWERLWAALWPTLSVTGLFLAVALYDLLPMLPVWLHIVVLGGFVAALLAALRHILRAYRPVDPEAVQRRLEHDNALRHRPLATLDDQLASGAGDPAAVALWQAHKERALRSVQRLRVKAPSPGIARLDRYALRVLVLLALVIGIDAGRHDIPQRLLRAVAPQFAIATEIPVVAQVWITPPAYTGQPPVFLDGDAPASDSPAADSPVAAEPLLVPAGSKVLAQVSGVDAPPILRMGGGETVFTVLGEAEGGRSFQAEMEITEGDRLSVDSADGLAIADWPVELIPDGPPRIDFAATPEATQRSHLRIQFEAHDDYGLDTVVAQIHRPGGPEGGEGIRLDLPVSGQRGTSVKGNTVRDLTAHLWAGLPVEARLTATDGRGQTGQSAVAAFVMPERTFNHPVARAIIEQRKRLIEPTEGIRERVAQAIENIANRPTLYGEDLVVYLALSIASYRLVPWESQSDRTMRRQALPATAGGVPDIIDLLWNVALRVEEGQMSIADQRFRSLQEELMEALREGELGEEFERLMDELRDALENVMAALQEEMMRQGLMDMPMPMTMPPDMQMMTADDFRQMLEQARELARNGATEAAQQMLAQLQQMIDQLRAGMQQQGPSQQQAQQAREMMNAMRDLIQRQQQLLDRNFQRSQQGQQGEQGQQGQQGQDGQDGQMQADAADQEALRKALQELMDKLKEMTGGQVPKNLQEAEQAMQGAADALAAGQSGQALPLQSQALDLLLQGAQSAAQQMAQQMGMGMMMGFGPGRRLPGSLRGQRNQDPFGRESEGNNGRAPLGQGRPIPSEEQMLRAREILEELRHRSGDIDRPKLELDYIDRLLRRF